MPKPLQCSQGHRWESGIGRQGQVLEALPVCPMCGAPPVRRWRDWHELPWPLRIVAFGLLAVVPCAAIGLVVYLLLPERLVRATFSGHRQPVTCLAFSPDGRLVASGSADHTIKLWQAGSGAEEVTCDGHNHAVVAVAFSPDGRTVGSGSRDGTARLWDAGTGKGLATIGGADPHAVVTFAPVGNTLAIAAKANRIVIWDYRLKLVRADWVAHHAKITCLAYAPDGETLASAGMDGKLHLWEVGRYKTLGFTGFGARLSGALAPGSLGPWHVLAAHLLNPDPPLFASLDVPGSAIEAMAFASDNRTLMAGMGDGTLMVWDAVSARRQEAWKGHNRAVLAVAFSAATRKFVTASAEDVQFWDLVDGQVKARSVFNDFAGRITALALSPDGQALAVAKDDNTIEVWNVDRLLKDFHD